MSILLNEDAIPDDFDYKGGRKSRRGCRDKESDDRSVFTSYPVLYIDHQGLHCCS